MKAKNEFNTNLFLQSPFAWRSMSRTLATSMIVLSILQWIPKTLAQSSYVRTDLVSDVPGLAKITDPNLVNPWGIAFSPTGPFWIADNHSGLSTVYNSTGGVQSLVVTVPGPTGSTNPGAPTGIVFNNTTDFNVSPGVPAKFIFAGEDAVISAWASGSNAVVKAIKTGTPQAIYKGLTLGKVGTNNFLYAADFHAGRVQAYDSSFSPAFPASAFNDQTIPNGFAPFNVKNINDNLYVTYAKQDADKQDDVSGPGNGFINVFDTSGNLIKRLVSNGPLNSPWGLAIAPIGFGEFGGALLVGNFGDGRINAFDSSSGAFLGTVAAANGDPISIQGLWALQFGNGGSGGNSNTLYFTAGIAAGGSVEDHGLFGSISVEPSSYTELSLVSDIPGLARITDPHLVNPWGIAFSTNGPFWISDNHSGLSTVYNSTGGVQSLVVNIPGPAGSTNPGAPTGIVFNNTTDFNVSAGVPAKFIFAGEDAVISAWASGSNAVVKFVKTGTPEAIYKGLTIGKVGTNNYLYAADFHAARVQTFDSSFSPAFGASAFQDPTIPNGFAPFNVQNIDGNLYVTYAMQDANKEDDISGPGNGFINVFDTSGNLIKRLVSNGPLNSPWGMTLVPRGFGLRGALLVGNFGDGRINAFDPTTGAFLGSLSDRLGRPFAIPGLWALTFGNGGSGGDASTLYFTAGIPGSGSIEDHGLFGSVSLVHPLRLLSISRTGANLVLSWMGGTTPFTVQTKTSLNVSNWVDLITTSNPTATIPLTNSSAFFRLAAPGE